MHIRIHCPDSVRPRLVEEFPRARLAELLKRPEDSFGVIYPRRLSEVPFTAEVNLSDADLTPHEHTQHVDALLGVMVEIADTLSLEFKGMFINSRLTYQDLRMLHVRISSSPKCQRSEEFVSIKSRIKKLLHLDCLPTFEFIDEQSDPPIVSLTQTTQLKSTGEWGCRTEDTQHMLGAEVARQLGITLCEVQIQWS